MTVLSRTSGMTEMEDEIKRSKKIIKLHNYKYFGIDNVN